MTTRNVLRPTNRPEMACGGQLRAWNLDTVTNKYCAMGHSVDQNNQSVISKLLPKSIFETSFNPGGGSV